MVIILYHFVDDFIQKRTPVRMDHLNYLETYVQRGLLFLGGALDPIKKMGLIVFGGSNDQAMSLVKQDPYIREGLVVDFEIINWNVVIGTMMDNINES